MPQNPGASLGWRIRHSLWLLLPIAGCGFLAGAGFLYIGLRARRPTWWIAGIVYLVIGWTSFATVGEADKTSTLSTVATVVLLAMWVASIVHGCLINSSWLRWRAGHVPWYARPQAPPPTWPGSPYPPAQTGLPSLPTSAPPAVAEIMPQPALYAGDGAAAALVPTQPSPPPAPQPPSAPVAAHPGALDVNAATFEQLAALAHFQPERAQRVVAERQVRRGFGSVEEFAAVANLAPHEFAHLRNLVTCVPQQGLPVGQPPPPGRVLDVAPTPPRRTPT
ncbi:helix-hairpin-helix domain-containing protein [Micromonospora sp. 4G57]|uniref:Helix-hairpin-helix domain-containing protein n=1 Tax=Micromonospora sicca TaxID=2202420 RepID=A0ABU5JNX1_9ACTN|nr:MULTISPECIES: helix-hairpin-helix domain-containing protein [unclassified Micromonospora]MDZ5447600.1 helix-hairpin-helix domain-containing protein [Micromonospora sp. 4G57]MDZ5494340.1 helix-hairpin-helix domain-containing protein [Micromonospora sp. 4G53]